MEERDTGPSCRRFQAAQAVSPLLCFRDAKHEAAAVACLQHKYARSDWRIPATGPFCLLLVAHRVYQAGQWAPALLAEALLLGALGVLRSRYNQAFMRWRSLVIAAFYVGHSLASTTAVPLLFGSWCPHRLTFFMRELKITQALWMPLFCISHPIPLKHMVWSQGMAVVSQLAYLPHLRVYALERCDNSEQHYMAAAEALTFAAGGVLPGPLGSAVLGLPQRLGPTGAFYAVHLALLLASYLGTLAFLFRFELSHRRVFARQHRMGDEAAALLLRKRQLHLGLPVLLLLFSVGWITCCCVVLCFRLVF